MKAISVHNLSKNYKEVEAVKNVSLEIEDGELFSLLGVNGAGKTTMIKLMTALIKPTSGKISVFGMEYESESKKIKELLNISPQETAIAPNLTVLENLEFMSGIYDIQNKKEKIDELVKLFKLEKVLGRKTKNLSGGYQRRLSLAISLINEPKILFLDEPTLGLDVISRRELWDILRNLKGKMTIILTTHYMEEAEELSDRVAIMKDGNILEIGKCKEILKKTKTKRLEDAFIKIVGGSL